MKHIIEKSINSIEFDKHYIEATFQFQLLMNLSEYVNKELLQPERNFAHYGFTKGGGCIKKEIDIVIEENKDCPLVAIELKMPMNGQYPETMFNIIKDIKFLENLRDKNFCSQYYQITVVNDKNFYEGKCNTNIYTYFRSGSELKGKNL